MISLWLRSLAFNVGWYVGSAIIAIVGLADPVDAAALSRRLVAVLDRFLPGWLRLTCRLTHRVSGLENMPAGPVIFACKHQSSWETLAFSRLFPNSATVLKRELLFIPVVGWAMARVGNIAVERGDGAEALRGLVRQAKAAIAEGRSILIYPEGTRTPVGSSLPYHAGTAALYRQLGVPVVPVALNSGRVLGTPQVHQMAGRHRRRGAAGHPAGPGPRGLHGDPARRETAIGAAGDISSAGFAWGPGAGTNKEARVDIGVGWVRTP